MYLIMKLSENYQYKGVYKKYTWNLGRLNFIDKITEIGLTSDGNGCIKELIKDGNKRISVF